MRRLLLLILIFVSSATVSKAQYKYSIDKCWEMAISNYPVIVHKNLINNSYNYSLNNVANAQIPEILSDEFFPASDGLLETNKYKLSDRVNNLYYGVILLDDKIVVSEMTQLYLIDILSEFVVSDNSSINNDANINILKSYQEEAIALHTKLRQIRVLYLDMLSNFIGEEIKNSTVFIKPDIRKYLEHKEQVVIEMQDFYKKEEKKQVLSLTINPNIQRSAIAQQFSVAKSSNVNNFSIGEDDIKLNNTTSISDIKEKMYSIDINKNKTIARTYIDKICEKIYAVDSDILTYREMLRISYTRLGEGKESIDIFIQNLKNYINLYHSQTELRVELMMEANKFKVLYE